MRKELIVKSRSLGGVSDLTLLAELEDGFVPALDAVTYKTRVKRLLKTLSLGRASSHEYALLRPFSDAVERVGKIHSVRVAVVEPNKVLLAVTFDGSWEAYLRVLWQKVGALLDVIFCNTKNYPAACDSPFEEWSAWVRRVQIETDFFYGMPRLTVDDVQYLRRHEQIHRTVPVAAGSGVAAGSSAALGAVRMANRSAEARGWDMARRHSPEALGETVRLALQSLSVIHRLTSIYPPTTALSDADGVALRDDSKFLHRAARELLSEFVRLKEETPLFAAFEKGARIRFAEQLDWLFSKRVGPEGRRVDTDGPRDTDIGKELGDVQPGILLPLGRNTHGALLLFAFDVPVAVQGFIDEVAFKAPDGPWRTLAFTVEGLRFAMGDRVLAWFPEEFREGMEARADKLGDFWHNHPRRWRLPRNVAVPGELVELCTVHAVVQLRIRDEAAALDLEWTHEDHPLRPEIDRLRAVAGCRLLAVETLARQYGDGGEVREHFGFVDGMSDPVFAGEGEVYDNRIPLGEVLLGHGNQADTKPSAHWSDAQRELLHNGSFLVVRKLRQDVAALHEALDNALEDPALKALGLARDDLLAKMMGRTRGGRALVNDHPANPLGNDFDYASDPQGSRCPLHAHIRRANPRPTRDAELPELPGGRFPRLLRRGMSYGPRYIEPTPEGRVDDRDRGLMFMAYNASIAEQFEVVQRWLAGGNSSGGFSGQSDPFLGVAEVGQRRSFRFELDQAGNPQACTLALDGSPTPLAPFRPFVRLEWGAYLFVPSLKGLVAVQTGAGGAPAVATPVWSAANGEELLDTWARQLARGSDEQRLEGLKALLEDPNAIERFEAADIWAAVRAHGGMLNTPDGGVLVCSHDLVRAVFERSGTDFSVEGYHARMVPSIGEIYLGLDDTGEEGCPYRAQSAAANQAIAGITREQAFAAAFDSVRDTLSGMVKLEMHLADLTGRQPWELNLNLKEIVDPVIQQLCVAWFGLPEALPADPLPDDREFTPGAARWDWTPEKRPMCPGHFTAPSRYFFQPWPSTTVEQFGVAYGQSLQAAMLRFVERQRRQGNVPEAPVARAIFGMGEDGLVARTMVGAMMGFIPTLDGALRLVLNEWLRDNDFWTLRSRHAAAKGDGEPTLAERLAAAEDELTPALTRAMQLRPMPEMVWRTVKRDCNLGGRPLKKGQKVAVSIVSALHEKREQGLGDVMAMFGGDRARAPFSHACPGYEAAMGAMLGTLYALVDSAHPMRPSPAPLALTLGPPLKALDPPKVKPAPKGGHASGMSAAQPPKRVLLAEGDSWFDHWAAPGSSSLLKPLMDDFEVIEVASAGDSLKAICDPKQGEELARQMKRLHGRGRVPHAILISAGGNDVMTPLAALLNDPALHPQQALNRVAAEDFVQALRGDYEKLLDHVITGRQKFFDAKVRIVLHGYDYPIPDGRGALGRFGNWLLPQFEARGWRQSEQEPQRRQAMRDLIDMLNGVLRELEAKFENVVHADLRGTLADAFGADHTAGWLNELHPTEPGFGLLAQKLRSFLP